VAFALATIFLAAVAVVAIVAGDTLMADGRVIRCARCHHYYIATRREDHVCHDSRVRLSWRAHRASRIPRSF
jgi:hypothetical protein